MRLRLFKMPYPEPFSEGKVRLLFERHEDAATAAPERLDFYLYVWIQDLRHLAGFQAVIDEEFVVDFHAPSRLEFTHITGKPVKRSLHEPLGPADRGMVLAHTTGMESAEFHSLVHAVESIIHGAKPASLELTRDERNGLMDLILPSDGRVEEPRERI